MIALIWLWSKWKCTARKRRHTHMQRKGETWAENGWIGGWNDEACVCKRKGETWTAHIHTIYTCKGNGVVLSLAYKYIHHPLSKGVQSWSIKRASFHSQTQFPCSDLHPYYISPIHTLSSLSRANPFHPYIHTNPRHLCYNKVVKTKVLGVSSLELWSVLGVLCSCF